MFKVISAITMFLICFSVNAFEIHCLKEQKVNEDITLKWEEYITVNENEMIIESRNQGKSLGNPIINKVTSYKETENRNVIWEAKLADGRITKFGISKDRFIVISAEGVEDLSTGDCVIFR